MPRGAARVPRDARRRRRGSTSAGASNVRTSRRCRFWCARSWRGCWASRCACSPRASAAGSAASRSCSSRTSSRWPRCGPGGRCGWSSRARSSSRPPRRATPMRVQVRAGARADGVLTALELSLLSDTGAYGNHGPGVMFHALGESLGVYRCPNKRLSGRVAYTHTVPAGAFRGYGLSPDRVRGRVHAGRARATAGHRRRGVLRDRNVVVPGDEFHGEDVEFGSYGLDQCLSLVEESLARGDGLPGPGRTGWSARGSHWRCSTRGRPAGTSPTRAWSAWTAAASGCAWGRSSSAMARRRCTGRSRGRARLRGRPTSTLVAGDTDAGGARQRGVRVGAACTSPGAAVADGVRKTLGDSAASAVGDVRTARRARSRSTCRASGSPSIRRRARSGS